MQLLMTSLLDNPIILEIDTVSKKKKKEIWEIWIAVSMI